MTPLLAVLLVIQTESCAEPSSPSGGSAPPVPLYTNADLERVHPYRHETGVASVPAVSAEEAPTRARPAARPRLRGEGYWRREAARVRERVASLTAQAETLRATLADRQAERRRTLGRGRSGETSERALRARITGLERRIRQLEDGLRERARRQRALPGWLR